MLYETRAILEPYAARLAVRRGGPDHWQAMAACLARAERPGVSPAELIDIDRECHEIIWAAAENRFLTDTLDMLYAQSDRLWHMYLADVADMLHAVDEHRPDPRRPGRRRWRPRRRAGRRPRPLLRSTDPRRRHPPPRPTPRRRLKPIRSVCFDWPAAASEADSSGGWSLRLKRRWGFFGFSRGGFGRAGSRSGP